MRYSWLAVLAAGILLGACHNEPDVALPSYQGKVRVVAAFTSSVSQAQSIANAFRSAPALDAGDVAWFVVGPRAIVSNQTQVPARARLERLHTVDGFQSVLLGKDGTLQVSQLGGLDIHGLMDTAERLPTPDNQ